MRPKCRKCYVVMVRGIALQNTPSYGIPDFPGQTDLRGQTMTMDGPVVKVSVWKCPQCGHSIANTENDNE